MIAAGIVAATALAVQIGRFLHMRLFRDAVLGEPMPPGDIIVSGSGLLCSANARSGGIHK
jgi:hypothetical protein